MTHIQKFFTFLVITLITINTWASGVTAQSWLIANEDGKILSGENTKEIRSIASITKLMTAMVILDAKQNMNELKPYTRKELIQIALIKSDNQATKELCHYYPGGTHPCVYAMNQKAKSLGLTQTKFIEPTGLSVFNVSTAEELIVLINEAKKYPEIVEASGLSEVKIKVKKKWLVFHNTNPIIGREHNTIVSKTGYIRASGGCIVMLMNTNIGKRIVVVLGSKNTKTRIPEAEFLVKTYGPA